MKKFSLLLIVVNFATIIFASPIYAQNPTQIVQCVVEAQPRYDTSSECKYTSMPGNNTDYYDSCYQKYLVRKKDWETRCFRYWDEQNSKNSNSKTTNNTAVNNSNSETEGLKEKLKNTEAQLNILLTQSAQPKVLPRIGMEGDYDFVPYITAWPQENILGETATEATPSPTITQVPTPTIVPTLLQQIGKPIFNLFSFILNLFKH